MILEKHPRQRKGLKSPELYTSKDLVKVQTLSRWLGSEPVNASPVHLYIDSAAELVVLAQRFPWHAIRYGLREWVWSVQSDVQGCADYCSKGFISWDGIVDAGCPLAVRLERLAVQGWVAGREEGKAHELSLDLSLDMSTNFTKRDNYYTCLLDLSNLFQGGLLSLATRMPNAYYSICLLAPEKNVAQNLSAQQYEFLLRRLVHCESFDLSEMPARKKQRCIVANIAAVFGPLPLVCAGSVGVSSAPAESAGDPAESDADSDDVVALIPSAAPVAARSRSRCLQPSSLPAVAVAASSLQPSLLPADVAFETLVREASCLALPWTVNGAPVKLEVCRNGTHGRQYARKMIKCQSGHPGCYKNRNCNLVGAGGQSEVLAYLKCWADSGAHPERNSTRTHMAYRPKAEEYLQALPGL
jgi:hypothetical protein